MNWHWSSVGECCKRADAHQQTVQATLYVACVVATAIGLIGANYHFLSDIIAGAFFGSFVGYVTMEMSLSR